MKNGIKTKVDIAVLQEQIEKIDERVDRIENNHLPHLQEKLESIEKKIAYYSGGLFVGITLLELIIKFLK